MKSNELRIGNFVSNKNLIAPVQISRISQDDTIQINFGAFKNVYTDIYNLQVFKPIPLTEEWLLKFGFFKYNNAYVLEKPTENIMSFHFSIWEDFTYNSSEFPVELKYVHQLQNLYFILTNKELEIK